jgi:hypothetical protein
VCRKGHASCRSSSSESMHGKAAVG